MSDSIIYIVISLPLFPESEEFFYIWKSYINLIIKFYSIGLGFKINKEALRNHLGKPKAWKYFCEQLSIIFSSKLTYDFNEFCLVINIDL